MTVDLDRLEESGHLTRVPSPEDRRKILIKRTDKNKVLEDVYTRVSQDMAKLFYGGGEARRHVRIVPDRADAQPGLQRVEATRPARGPERLAGRTEAQTEDARPKGARP